MVTITVLVMEGNKIISKVVDSDELPL